MTNTTITQEYDNTLKMRKIINWLLRPILQGLGISNWMFVQVEKMKLRTGAASAARKIKQVKKGTNAFKGIPLICVLDEQLDFVDFFIDYYTKLGIVDFHFFYPEGIDVKAIETYENCNLYTLESTENKEIVYNYFLKKCKENQWLTIIESNEYIIYPNYKTRNIIELSHFLDNLEEGSFFTTTIEMYRRDEQNVSHRLIKDPLRVYKYFDRFNLTQQKNGSDIFDIKGGPEMRIHKRLYPADAPNLNRLTLIKKDKHVRFIEDNKATNAPLLNSPLQREKRVITGCVLKLVLDEEKYSTAKHKGLKYKDAHWSKTFIDDKQLENEKFMQRGEWF